jgi:hypothetical protein
VDENAVNLIAIAATIAQVEKMRRRAGIRAAMTSRIVLKIHGRFRHEVRPRSGTDARDRLEGQQIVGL